MFKYQTPPYTSSDCVVVGIKHPYLFQTVILKGAFRLKLLKFQIKNYFLTNFPSVNDICKSALVQFAPVSHYY